MDKVKLIEIINKNFQTSFKIYDNGVIDSNSDYPYTTTVRVFSEDIRAIKDNLLNYIDCPDKLDEVDSYEKLENLIYDINENQNYDKISYGDTFDIYIQEDYKNPFLRITELTHIDIYKIDKGIEIEYYFNGTEDFPYTSEKEILEDIEAICGKDKRTKIENLILKKC